MSTVYYLKPQCQLRRLSIELIKFRASDTKFQDTSDITHCKTTAGKVEFDFGLISHPSFGTRHIKGRFPRITPRQSRDDITPEELMYASKALASWVAVYFNQTEDRKYWINLVEASVLFTLYLNRFSHIKSREMDAAIKTYFWLWILDDMLEYAIKQNIPSTSVEDATNQLLGVLRGGKTQKFRKIDGLPKFDEIYHSLFALCEDYKSLGCQDEANYEQFLFRLERWFDALRWHCTDGAMSDETFLHWRGLTSFSDGAAEVLFFLRSCKLPKKILNSPTLCRLLEVYNAVGALTNDLLGLQKELAQNDTENFVVFKILQKGTPVEDAVRETCKLIESSLKDFIFLRDSVLKQFHYDESLVEYIDIIESCIDGHNKLYMYSARYAATESIILSRRNSVFTLGI